VARGKTKTGGAAATTGVIPGRYALSVGQPPTTAPDGWRWTLLTDVARLETGHTPSRKHPEYWDGDIPWIGIRDATENHGRVLRDTAQHTNQAGIDNSSARLLPAHTVCLSRTASVGYVVVMDRPMATSQDFVNWVCGEGLDWRYLMYVLLAEKESYSMFSHGTTHQTIYFPEVKAFHVCLPPLDEQRRIAGVLSAFDEKIEHNEEMADRLRRLLQLRSEELFDAAEVDLPLTAVARFVNGRAFTKDANGSGRPILRIKELNGGVSESTLWADLEVDLENVARPGDLLFSWSGSLDVYRWGGPEALINQHIFKVIPMPEYPVWLAESWVRLHLPEFQAIAAGKATTMGHIQRRHLEEALVPAPGSEVINGVRESLDAMDALRTGLLVENLKLRAVRDLLMSKLVSGQLRVSRTYDPSNATGFSSEDAVTAVALHGEPGLIP
jgi:type I restriction enzyme S subunit